MLKLMRNTPRDQTCRDFRNARLPTAPNAAFEIAGLRQAPLAALNSGYISRPPYKRGHDCLFMLIGEEVSSIFVCSARGPEVALKRPTVALAEGLLIEAVLKHACVVPNRP